MRKPLFASLPRIEVIHELSEHEQTCACGCSRHAISDEVNEQLEIVSMQIRLTNMSGESTIAATARPPPVTADKASGHGAAARLGTVSTASAGHPDYS
jgi:transposase